MTGKVGFISLGCPKALVDSEQLLTALTAEGYTTADDYSEADVVVVNTCGFIDAAIEESFDAIEEALDACGKVVVTGCLGARKDSLQERYPELLSVSGPQDPVPVVDAVRAHVPLSAAESTHYHLGPAGVKLTPAHYAYLKVAEGCNHTCSFCIIPSMRGKLRSRALPCPPPGHRENRLFRTCCDEDATVQNRSPRNREATGSATTIERLDLA